MDFMSARGLAIDIFV